MDEKEFERLLTQALIRSAEKSWLEQPSEQDLLQELPDLSVLDERIRQVKGRQEPVVMPKRAPRLRRVLRYAAMIFLTCTVLFGVLMMHPQAREYVFNFVVDWYEDHIEYSFLENEGNVIPTDWELAYIPEGFVQFYEERTEKYCYFMYENAEGALLDISIMSESGRQYNDNEHYNITRIIYRDGVADVYEATESRSPNMIVWYREELGALVTALGDVPMEELFLVLDHMTP